VGQLVTAERNMREVSNQQMNKALQGVHDTIEGDRSAVQDGVKLMMSHIGQTRELFDHERMAREAFEERHRTDIETISEQMKEMTTTLKMLMSQYSVAFEKSRDSATAAIEGHGRDVAKTRNDVELAQTEITLRLALQEERTASMEQRVLDSEERHSEAMSRLYLRSERFHNEVEQVKYQSGDQGDTIDEVAKKLETVKGDLKESESSTREMQQKDKKQREDELRSMRECMLSEHNLLLGRLETKLMTRVEDEASNRHQEVENVMTTVAGALRDARKDTNKEQMQVPSAPAMAQSTPSVVRYATGPSAALVPSTMVSALSVATTKKSDVKPGAVMTFRSAESSHASPVVAKLGGFENVALPLTLASNAGGSTKVAPSSPVRTPRGVATVASAPMVRATSFQLGQTSAAKGPASMSTVPVAATSIAGSAPLRHTTVPSPTPQYRPVPAAVGFSTR